MREFLNPNGCWKRLASRAPLAGLVLLSACVTGNLKNLGHDLTSLDDIEEKDAISDGPVTKEQIQTYYKTAKDPRQYWITVYPSKGGPVFVGSHRVHSGQQADVKMLSEDENPVPVIRISGWNPAEYTALIDTSTGENWVEFLTAISLPVVPLGFPGFTCRAVHVPDTTDGYLGVVDKLRVEEMHIETALFFARGEAGTLGPMNRGLSDPEPLCVLGSRFLRPFNHVRFDFAARSVHFSATDDYQPKRDQLLTSVPLLDAGGALAVEGGINGKPETIILDTAGNYTIALPESEETMLRHISLGDLVLRNLACASCEELQLGLVQNPHVGLELLKRFVVTIDNAKGVVHFERHPVEEEE